MSRVLAAALLAVITAPATFAGVNRWNGSGPEGGSVHSIAVDPSTPTRVFAGGDGGLYRSDDAGATWQRLTVPGMCAAAVPNVVIDPRTASTVYVATSCSFHRSLDGGASWTRSPSPAAGRVAAIAIDPVTPNVLWGSSGSDVGIIPGGLSRSTDGGEHWEPAGFADHYMRAVAIAPTTPRRILAVSASDGVLVSQDEGSTWTKATGLANADLHTIVVDPNDSNRVYAAGYTGLFTSDDGGVSWQPATATASTIIALPTVPTTVYGLNGGSIIRSTDAGLHWDIRFPVLADTEWWELRHIAASPDSAGGLYVASLGGGMLRGGFDDPVFTPSNRGLVHTWIGALAADPSASGTIFAGAIFGGAFRSTNGGRSWTSLDVPTDDARLWAIAPTEPPTIYVGGLGSISRSSDGGASWSFPPTSPGTAPNALVALAVDPVDPTTVYAAANAEGIFRSTGGGDWERRNTGIVRTREGYIYVPEHTLVIDPGTPSTLYVVANGRLYRSVDSAGRWDVVSTAGVEGITTLVLDPQMPTRLHATGYADGSPVFLTSDDAGVSWTVIPLATADYVLQLIVDPASSDRLWARTHQRVLLSRDRGRHWFPVMRGLPDTLIQSLAVDLVTPRFVYAGLGGHGAVVYEDRCGDGVVDAFEACDDANAASGDGCRADCASERGGDGVVDPGEECDDGNLVDGDGCDSNQTRTRCGNGIVAGGEQCDDGNLVGSDGCDGCFRSCQTSAECDDGTSCTVDACDGRFCSYQRPTDAPTIERCADSTILGAVSCVGTSLPARFVERVERVAAHLESMADGGGGSVADRRRAFTGLRRLARRTRTLAKRVTRPCAVELRQLLRQTKADLETAWVR